MFFRTIIKIMILPIISIVAFVGFFLIFLTPQQSSSIFNEVFSRIPVINNFVEKSFNSQAFALKLEDVSELKIATWAIDQLVLIEDRAGKKYYAVSPFVLEAGFDLAKAKMLQNGEELTISLPAAKILSNGTDEKRNMVVIRNDLAGKYDELLQPLKMAYSKKVYDLALTNNILKIAEKNAKTFLKDFWKPIYKNVKVEISRQEGDPFKTYDFKRLPFSFRVRKAAVNLSKIDFPELESAVGFIKDDKEVEYDIFFVDEFRGSQEDLNKIIVAMDSNLEYFITYSDPINPREISWMGGVNKKGSFIGVYQTQGSLYALSCVATDTNSSLYSKAIAIYLLSSILKNNQFDVDKCEEYRDFVLVKNDAIEAFKAKQMDSYYSLSHNLHNMDSDSVDANTLYNIARGIKNGIFFKTGCKDIDCLLKTWICVHYGEAEYLDAETRKQLRKYFHKNNKAFGEFCAYLIEKKDLLSLDESEIDEAENYLIDNKILSKRLLANLGKSKLRDLFNGWICNKVNLFYDRYSVRKHDHESFTARGLFCDFDYNDKQKLVPFVRKNTPYPFFDYYALKSLHSKGKSTVNNKLSFYEPQLYTVVILSDEGIIFDSYDAFLLEKDGLTVIRGFENGFESEDVTWLYYSDLNVGSYQVMVAGKTYKNATLFYLLKKLSGIYSSSMNEDVSSRFEETILGELINKANNFTWTWKELSQTLSN